MHHTRLLELVYNRPLLIMEPAFWSIHRLVEAHLFGAEQRARTANDCGEEVTLPSMTVENGLAQIPIGGAIGMKLGNYAKLAGAVDVADIEADITEAEADPSVNAILFDIDSPGGMAMGTPELAARIGEIEKPKYAFSNGYIASAAYYLASATDGVFITPSAEAGSIGTLMVYMDKSEMYKEAGIRPVIIKAGKFKGMGTPGTSLSEDQVALLQDEVNSINDAFKAHVRSFRGGDIADSTMQGQMFVGRKAADAGLVDTIVKNKSEVISLLTSRA